MVFNSLAYIIFFFAVLLLYYVLPQKFKAPLLLIASIGFYSVYSIPLLMYLVACVLITFGLGLLIDKNAEKPGLRKALVIIGIVAQAATLVVFKYTDFFIDIFNAASSNSIDHFNILAPLGISFITFTGISYLVDVNKKKIRAERNLLYYALFISFFPKVIQGPIEKAGDMIPQFNQEHKFDLIGVREGLLTAIFGFFMKMVIADRAAIPVDTVFSDIAAHSGIEVLAAILLFTLQLYADFAGYSLIAIGCAKALGFKMNRNFAQPYLSLSVSEFWRRWHASLNVWLKDYIYIPMGGSRCGKLRKYFNVMVTFLVSGFWHGAAVGYILWGAVNGIYVVGEGIFRDLFGKGKKPESEKKNIFKNFFRHLKTILLVIFSWIFFRAQTWDGITNVFKQLFSDFGWKAFKENFMYMLDYMISGSFLGLNLIQCIVLLVSAAVLVCVDILVANEKTSALKLAQGNRVKRWILLYIVLFMTIIFGIYGYGYNASSFIYTQF